MATFIWNIDWMDTTALSANPAQQVVKACWKCTATEGEHTVSTHNLISFEGVGDPFIPYSQLTEAQVLSWCHLSGIDKDATEALLQEQLNDIVNPRIIQSPLPWVAQ